jgi:hypothetical protein
MSTVCTKDLSIQVRSLPRCNCAGEVDTGTRLRIVGYFDGMLNPLCAHPCQPGIGGPVWDGTFDVPGPDFCSWGSSLTGIGTINGKLLGSCAVGNYGPDFWRISVQGVWFPTGPYFWYGTAPIGSGLGTCNSPLGWTYTAEAPFSPPFCGVVPLTLTLEEYTP